MNLAPAKNTVCNMRLTSLGCTCSCFSAEAIVINGVCQRISQKRRRASLSGCYILMPLQQNHKLDCRLKGISSSFAPPVCVYLLAAAAE